MLLRITGGWAGGWALGAGGWALSARLLFLERHLLEWRRIGGKFVRASWMAPFLEDEGEDIGDVGRLHRARRVPGIVT